jgi:hypothetical protein
MSDRFRIKALQRLPLLRSFAAELIEIGDELLRKEFTFRYNEHFAFLTVCLAHKQHSHLRSVCLLVDKGQHRDAAVIGRVMVECMVIQLWAAQKPAERAWLWRSFALVSDFQLLHRKLSSGESVPAVEADRITQRAIQEAPHFLRKTARDALHSGKPLPINPFLEKWHISDSGSPLSTAGLFAAVGANLQYGVYSKISDWVHSNPRGVGAAIKRTHGTYTFETQLPEAAADALAGGGQALEYSLRILDGQFGMGRAGRLAALKERFPILLEPL